MRMDVWYEFFTFNNQLYLLLYNRWYNHYKPYAPQGMMWLYKLRIFHICPNVYRLNASVTVVLLSDTEVYVNLSCTESRFIQEFDRKDLPPCNMT